MDVQHWAISIINGQGERFRFSKYSRFIWRMINLSRLIIRQANRDSHVSFLSLYRIANACTGR